MKALKDYGDALTDNIATLQRLLANHQYEEALACMQGEIVNILLKIKNSFLPTKQILIGL